MNNLLVTSRRFPVSISPALLFLLLLAAFALRLYRLGVASLWYDETVSLFLARQDLVALTRHTAGDIHPPLYYYLLHFWGRVAGWSEFSAAFVSVLFGILLVALVYRVGRAWVGTRVALTAALLVSVSPYNLWYSQEVRMYTLGAFLGLASVFFFVRMWMETSASKRQLDFAAYVIASALGIYTLYYLIFLLVFENLVALWLIVRQNKIHSALSSPFYGAGRVKRDTTKRGHGVEALAGFVELDSAYPANPKGRLRAASTPRGELLGRWALAQVAILVLYAPWIPVAFRQATDPPVPPWRSFASLGDVLSESFGALTLGQSIEPTAALPVLVLTAVVLGFALGRNRAGNPLFLLAYTFVPVLLIYALSLWKPLYHVRYVFTYSPAFYLLLAVGLVRIYDSRLLIKRLELGRLAFYAMLVLLLGASAFSSYNFWFNPAYADDDLRGAVQQIAAKWRPGDAILLNAGYTYTAFDYYFTLPVAWRGRLTDYVLRDAGAGAVVVQSGSIGGNPNLGWASPESDFYATTAEETRSGLDRLFDAHPRVWMLRLYDTVVDPQGIIRDYVATHGRIFDDVGLPGNAYARVDGFVTPRGELAELPATATVRRVLFDERVELLGFEPGSVQVRVGTPLDVNLYWQARQATNLDLHLFVGLFDASGKLAASTGEVPLGNAWGTGRWSPGQVLREPVRLFVQEGLAPGSYTLRVALYNPLTGEPLAASPGEWVVEETLARLTAVQVVK